MKEDFDIQLFVTYSDSVYLRTDVDLHEVLDSALSLYIHTYIHIHSSNSAQQHCLRKWNKSIYSTNINQPTIIDRDIETHTRAIYKIG